MLTQENGHIINEKKIERQADRHRMQNYECYVNNVRLTNIYIRKRRSS